MQLKSFAKCITVLALTLPCTLLKLFLTFIFAETILESSTSTPMISQSISKQLVKTITLAKSDYYSFYRPQKGLLARD